MKNKIVHNITINVEDSTYTARPALEIHQGDQCSHVLLFQLCNNDKSNISINEDCKLLIEFYKDKYLITSEDVNIINSYRGTFSYVVGSAVVKDYGKYTAYVKLIDCNDNLEIFTIPFVVTVIKSHDYEFKSNEVALTKKFHDQLKDHLSDSDIHLNILDRDFLDTFNEETEELLQLIKDYRESEWIVLNGCNHKNCTCENYCTCLEYLVAIPEGKVMLTKSVQLKDYKDTRYRIDAPAYIIHTKESVKIKCDTCHCDENKCDCDCCSKIQTNHEFTIISRNDVVLYDETIDPDGNKSGLWISLRKTPTPEDLDEVVKQFNDHLDTLTNNVNTQLEEVNQHISSLDTAVTDINSKVDNLTNNVNTRIDSLTTQIEDVRTSTEDYVNQKFTESTEYSDDRLQDAKEYADSLKSQSSADYTKKIEDLDKKVDDNKLDTDNQIKELESTINTTSESLDFKITNVANTLSQSITDAESRSKEYTDTEVGKLKDTVDSNKSDADSRLTELDSKITTSTNDLYQQVTGEYQKYTDDKVSDIESRLESTINNNQTITNTEIEKLKQKDIDLDTALSALRTDTENDISTLATKIDDTKNEINQTITDTSNVLSTNIQDLRSDVEQADTALDTKIDTKNSEMKTYVDQLLSTNDAMIFKGTVGENGTVSSLPITHDIGWTYKVITPGVYASQTFEVGDLAVSMTKVAPEIKDLVLNSRVPGPVAEDFVTFHLHGDTLDNESYLVDDLDTMTLRLSASSANYHYGDDDQYRILIGRPTLIDNIGIDLSSNDYDSSQGAGEKGDALYGDGQSADKNYILGFLSTSNQGSGKIQSTVTFQHREYQFPSIQWVTKAEGTLEFSFNTMKLVHDENEWTGIQTNEDGLVIGPSDSVAESIPLFDGTTGKIIKDSGVTLSDIDKEITDVRNDLGTHIGQSDTRFTEVDQKIEDSKLRWGIVQ